MLRPLLACLITAALVAADAPAQAKLPTPTEWATTQRALKADPITGQAKLGELIKAYPAWADGPLALARLHKYPVPKKRSRKGKRGQRKSI